MGFRVCTVQGKHHLHHFPHLLLGLRSRGQVSAFMVYGLWFMVYGLWIIVSGVGLRVCVIWFRVWSLGFWV
jgi:hypothetical protein